MTYSQFMMVISFVLMILGIFTPLPVGVFGVFGITGMITGWIIEYARNKKITKEKEDFIDVEFTVEETTKMSFDMKLRKLQELKRDELITEEEFEKKRREILKAKW